MRLKMWFCFGIILFLNLLALVPCVPVSSSASPKCGYQACHPIKKDEINIHLIPHSHDDVGWLKTVEQYYYGLRTDIYDAGVQFIYDSTVASLKKNKDRKFIYVETAYFWKWWQEQNQEMRNDVRQLVKNGQIEFVGGGWSMNDEAVTTYQSTIDQMTWGLRRLNDTFGACAVPKMGWQIDPFGHSSEMASIFAGLGFDGVMLGRIDYQDQEKRLLNKRLEMVWRGSESLGATSDIFTGILFRHYDAPDGFNFGGDVEPLVDDVDSEEYNIAERVKDFLMFYVDQARTSYATSNILVPMGSDFAYQNAEKWYASMDKLIKFINNHTFFGQKYNIMYSTPSCYVYAVHKETKGKIAAPLKTDDFFPYASDEYSYWTGYYTSRPTLKRFERIGNSFLQSCKQLSALANLTSDKHIKKLTSLREAMGIMQHHDAVTGTEKEVVAHDYARLLNRGIEECKDVTSEALSKLTVQNVTFEPCLLTNISQCYISEHHKSFVVTVQNIMSRPINKYIRLPVLGSNFSIKTFSGEEVPWQLVPVAESVRNYTGRKSKAIKELVFDAENIPPLGFKSYFVETIKGDEDGVINSKTEKASGDVVEVQTANKNITLFMSAKKGTLEKLTANGIHLNLQQNFLFYNGSNGIDNETDITRASGAYIFRPDVDYRIGKLNKNVNFSIYTGSLVTEIHQTFDSWISQVIKVYKDRNYVEFNWMVGPLNSETFNGKEVITRFTTSLKTNSTFYTDSNSRGLLKRIRNYRPTWNLTTNETESANYYPVTSQIGFKDLKKDIGLVLLTDRAHGGSSLRDGELELMLHRSTVLDDGLGVDEPLAEEDFSQGLVVRGQTYLVVGKTKMNGKESNKLVEDERDLKEINLMEPQIFLSVPKEKSFKAYKKAHVMKFEGILRSLPKNVHVLTLEPWKESSYLVRLEHLYETNEHSELSKSAVVNLQELFSTFKIKNIRETTLGANQWLEDNHRLKFIPNDEVKEATNSKSYKDENNAEEFKVRLTPQQIRTFIVNLEK